MVFSDTVIYTVLTPTALAVIRVAPNKLTTIIIIKRNPKPLGMIPFFIDNLPKLLIYIE